MSTEESSPDASERLLGGYLAYVIAGVVLCAIAIAVVFTMRAPQRTEKKSTELNSIDTLDSVRSGLANTTDFGTCKSAVQQLNLYFSQHPDAKPLGLSAEQRDRVTAQYLGDRKQVNEIEGGSFTLLDAHHLESCFLFHDAAQSLEVDGLPQAEQAVAAFRWVVRQVRLRAAPRQIDEAPTPPVYVLRRGSGTAPERALVFLALLHQLGIEGCLIATNDGASPTYWACGAMVEGKTENDVATTSEVLLFDPRMGLPLPGTDRKGILTLSALVKKPESLKALTINPDQSYDITSATIATTEIHLVAPLSALAPRMQFLEEKVLRPKITCRLSVDMEKSFKSFTNAAPESEGKKIAVRVASHVADVLRRFLPPDEGGTDKAYGYDPRRMPGFVSGAVEVFPVEMTRKKQFEFELTPWLALPPFVRNLLPHIELGSRPRLMFAQTFVSFYLEPRKPRDLILRGHYDDAVEGLVTFRDQLKNFEKRLVEAKTDPAFLQRVNEFAPKGKEVFSDLARAEQSDPARVPDAKQRVAAFWNQSEQLLAVELQGKAAEQLKLESTFQLALAKHEQAERLHARLVQDRKNEREANPADVLAVKNAWETALSWWGDADLAVIAPVVRWHKAEAHLALGNKAAARAMFEDLSGDLTPLEKTARLWRAANLKD
jgi:hypothetical protein